MCVAVVVVLVVVVVVAVVDVVPHAVGVVLFVDAVVVVGVAIVFGVDADVVAASPAFVAVIVFDVAAAVVVVVVAAAAGSSSAAAATLDPAALTPAVAELELSLNATSNAAPTIPIATAVPAETPPAAPADSDCVKHVTGDKPIITDSINVYSLFFIMSSLEAFVNIFKM